MAPPCSNLNYSALVSCIDTWNTLRVLVIGDAMLDCYLHGTAERLCQEAPVPVVALTDRQDRPGGAANTAANLASLGARPQLFSVIGMDEAGERLQRCLSDRAISTTSLLRSPERITLMKQRIVAQSHLLLRLDQGSTTAIDPSLEQTLAQQLCEAYRHCDAVVISDYGYGVLTPALIAILATLQSESPRPIVLDAKHPSPYRSVGVTAVKPNYQETLRLLGLSSQEQDRVQQILPYRQRLLTLTGAALVIVTLDRDGVLLLTDGQPGPTAQHLPVEPAPANHASGAGDTFVSALTLALAAQAQPEAAVALAAAAAAVVVQQPGTSVCAQQALRHQCLKQCLANV
ncbi:MAG: bifunctional hydroxymethylpyrimidine kinase/phosphomethylpyrimidine kinase [Synechococcales cyanobacterium C42_A2020_086]|nr:bifunctional hydroxymethylpyrimidine kinase/phosphomethylpyrimidine kinase [Synechococcales cyanobacterium C42_A2020_086]